VASLCAPRPCGRGRALPRGPEEARAPEPRLGGGSRPIRVAVPDQHTDLPLFTEHGPEPERDMAHDEGPPLGDDNVIDILRARF
jgi:hypothetical protein